MIQKPHNLLVYISFKFYHSTITFTWKSFMHTYICRLIHTYRNICTHISETNQYVRYWVNVLLLQISVNRLLLPLCTYVPHSGALRNPGHLRMIGSLSSSKDGAALWGNWSRLQWLESAAGDRPQPANFQSYLPSVGGHLDGLKK